MEDRDDNRGARHQEGQCRAKKLIAMCSLAEKRRM